MISSREILIISGVAICLAGFVWFVISLLTKQLGRVFSLTYKTYRPTLPQALNVWRGRSGYLHTRIPTGFRLKGLIKVELFPNGLLVGVVGKALWLPFGTYKFTVSPTLLNKLSVENIPVQPIPLFFGFNFFPPTTTLTLGLPKKACEEILRLQEDTIKQK